MKGVYVVKLAIKTHSINYSIRMDFNGKSWHRLIEEGNIKWGIMTMIAC